MSQKSLTDIPRHRDRRVVHLLTQRSVGAKCWPFYELSNAIALFHRCLPHAQVLESINDHAIPIRTFDANDRRSRIGGWFTCKPRDDQGPTAKAAKDQGREGPRTDEGPSDEGPRTKLRAVYCRDVADRRGGGGHVQPAAVVRLQRRRARGSGDRRSDRAR